MSLEEEIKKVLLNNPSILVDVLTAKPEIIYQALSKLTPWQNLATKQDIEELKRDLATKEDVKRVRQELDDIRKVMATKDDIRKLDITITGLGARWGIMNEDAFREGVRELLKDAGWKVSREVLYDKEGYVYGEPSDVEYDVVIRDVAVTLIEITSSLKRGGLPVIRKKRELYEKVKNVKVNLVYLITPFIHDRYPERVKAMARDMQIEVVYPTP